MRATGSRDSKEVAQSSHMDGHCSGSGRRQLLRIEVRQARTQAEVQRDQEEEGRRPWIGLGRPKCSSSPGARPVRAHRGVPAQLLHVHAPPPQRHRGDGRGSKHRRAVQETYVETPFGYGCGVS